MGGFEPSTSHETNHLINFGAWITTNQRLSERWRPAPRGVPLRNLSADALPLRRQRPGLGGNGGGSPRGPRGPRGDPRRQGTPGAASEAPLERIEKLESHPHPPKMVV